MKLSETAITILKNFQNINEAIVIKPGNIIATVAPKTKTQIMGVATVPDSFMNTMAIADLQQFVGCLSLFNEPDLTFYENYVTINQGNASIRYTFCDERAVTTPKAYTIPLNDLIVSFDLTVDDMKGLVKSGGFLKAPEYRFLSEAGQVVVKTCDSKNPSGNEYSFHGPETDSVFDFLVDKEAIANILPRTYHVDIAKNGIIRFGSDTLTYYIVGKVQR